METLTEAAEILRTVAFPLVSNISPSCSALPLLVIPSVCVSHILLSSKHEKKAVMYIFLINYVSPSLSLSAGPAWSVGGSFKCSLFGWVKEKENSELVFFPSCPSVTPPPPPPLPLDYPEALFWAEVTLHWLFTRALKVKWPEGNCCYHQHQYPCLIQKTLDI